MKKLTFLILACSAFFCSKGQVITDTVSIGASYANQVWYSLSNKVQGTAPINNWDLAFDVSYMGFSVAINSTSGSMLWKYPKADTGGWNSIDTSGIDTWQAHWNSVTNWHFGAIGNYPGSSSSYDVDWGIYDFATHSIIGDSLYIIRLKDGTFKKLWIESSFGTVFIFKYADLTGANLYEDTLDKRNFSGKNLGYYSIQTHTQLDREPLSSKWNLVFTTYTALTPSPHTEAAVLSNDSVSVAKCSGIANVNTYTDYASSFFYDSINTIGHDWKIGSGSSYYTQDSLLYFVLMPNYDIWKVVFKGFGGSANGNYIFTKQQLNTATAIPKLSKTPTAGMTMYPNPATNNYVTVVYNLSTDISSAILMVNDITGKQVYADKINTKKGLNQYTLPLNNMQPGTYIVTITTEGILKLQQKLIIQ